MKVSFGKFFVLDNTQTWDQTSGINSDITKLAPESFSNKYDPYWNTRWSNGDYPSMTHTELISSKFEESEIVLNKANVGIFKVLYLPSI